jgi:hypothetical protein
MLSVALYARVRPHHSFAHETAGAARTRHSLRPLSSRGAEISLKLRALSRREIAELCSGVSYVIASEAKQSIATEDAEGWIASLRSQ